MYIGFILVLVILVHQVNLIKMGQVALASF